MTLFSLYKAKKTGLIKERKIPEIMHSHMKEINKNLC